MAYPDPIPALKEKDAKLFLQKLDEFNLSASQMQFYEEARKKFPSHK